MTTIDERIAKLEKELAELKEERKKEKTVTRFEPEFDEKYSFVTAIGSPCTVYWIDNADKSLDSGRRKICNVFRTSSEENLKKYAHDVIRVQNRLMQLHEELCPEYWPDWKPLKTNYHIWYHHGLNKWVVSGSDYAECHDVNFTDEAAKKACEILNAEKFMMGGGSDEAD